MIIHNYLFASLLYFGIVPAALACAFHASPEIHLEGMYPGSLSVAIALRNGADNGIIDAAALEAASTGHALYIDSVHRLHELRKAIAESSAIEELPANFSLGYVESNLWSRYSQSDGGVHVDVHTDGPTDSETVVLTGEPVLKELLTGRLSVDQALADGMMIIDGSQTDISAIRHVLQATPAIDRISRR